MLKALKFKAENDLSKLIEDADAFYQENGYADSTISKMRMIWCRYVEYANESHLDERESTAFLKSEYNVSPELARLDKRKRIAKRAMDTLFHYQTHKKPLITVKSDSVKRPAQFETAITAFLSDLVKKGRSQSTCYNYILRLNDFSLFLDENGLADFEELNHIHIADYLAHISNNYKGMSLTAVLSQLRVFCSFLYLKEYKKVDLALLFPKSQVQRSRERLPSIWEKDEVDRIIKCIDRASPLGKRDYAIIMLVTELGLRVSDVVDLQLSSLNWENESIDIVQRKTDAILSTFLMQTVGDAIIDYPQNSRPKTDSKYVFVTHNYPYQGFAKKANFHTMICRYMFAAGIEVTVDKSHGLHSMRHTMATNLHKSGVSAESIEEILGHKKLGAAKQYIRVDTDQLRTCTLSLEGLDAE